MSSRASSAVLRPARAEDVDALVGLRLENARVHVALDPAAYRVPDPEAVRRAFSGWLADQGSRPGRILVAIDGPATVGMCEVYRRPPPPEDQILVPVPVAEIHTVVASTHRGGGVGGMLLAAAEAWARDEGLSCLVAGIHAGNVPAVEFYRHAGFRSSGLSGVKRL